MSSRLAKARLFFMMISPALVERPRRLAPDEFDYERLADMVAARLRAAESGLGTAEASDAARSRRKT